MQFKFQKILLILLFTVKVNASALGDLARPEDDVAPEHNWTRTFILKDGKNTITYTPEAIVIGTGMSFGRFTSVVGSSINGMKIENQDLVISKQMTYEAFVNALVASKIYEDKLGNWYGEFLCTGGLKIIHMPQGVILQQNGETKAYQSLILERNADHILTGALSYDVFVGILEASGYYKESD